MKSLSQGLIILIITSFYIFTPGCSNKVEDKIAKVKTGMSMSDVIQTLGKPYKAKEHPMGILVFVYKGEGKYYWVMFAPMTYVVMDVKQEDSAEFFPASDVDVVVSEGRVELRRSP